MADLSDSVALLSLEDDLTCSICLCPFENPVSLNCGHSFCLNCLNETWRDAVSFYCPHCRTHYVTKPELKKNTVLSAVVETFRTKAGAGAGAGAGNADDSALSERRAPCQLPKPVLCDSCMVAEAVKTCLTCMASYCEQHVRPHLDNPVFRAHELHEPLPDLNDRLCPDHGKLMEFFCERHERPICSTCLQQSHRDCGFRTPDDIRQKKETDMRDKLNTLDGKIEKNNLVITQMKEQQTKLKEIAAVRKRALQSEYRQLIEMLQRDEQDAIISLDKELETGHSKLNTLMKKFYQNVEKMSATRGEITQLLSTSQSLQFLQASVEMPSVVNFEPYSPRINLDSNRTIAFHSSVVKLKELISKVLHEPVENRITLLRPELINPAAAFSEPSSTPGFRKGDRRENNNPRDFREPRTDNFRGGEDARHQDQSSGVEKNAGVRKKPRDKKVNKEQKGDKSKRGPGKAFNANFSQSMEKLDDLNEQKQEPLVSGFPNWSFTPGSAVVRESLLQYKRNLTFDVRTAHKRVTLTENNSKASVSDDPSPYPDLPSRFTVCSQVLCSQSFSQGCHYWEVKMSSNNFCGLGLAYGSIDRKGPSSRLGRNGQSWCVEWFNIKLSAWHNSSETVLHNPNPSRVGVMLDCSSGMATFFNVADRAYPFHTFVFPFNQPVYPAFWMFSSGSTITLCKQN